MGLRVVALLIAAAIGLSAQAAVITQKSTVGGVTVAATAGNLGPDTSVWDFAVALDSRDRALRDDLVTSAVLVDPRGVKHKALIWEGASGDGTHRAGVLKFIALEPRPEWVELRIARPGEKKPRSFGWLLGNGLMAERDR